MQHEAERDGRLLIRCTCSTREGERERYRQTDSRLPTRCTCSARYRETADCQPAENPFIHPVTYVKFDTETKFLEQLTGVAGNIYCCGDVFSPCSDTLDSRQQNARVPRKLEKQFVNFSSTDKDGDSSQTTNSGDLLNKSTRMVKSTNSRSVEVSTTKETHSPVSWRPTTVKWRQFSQSNRHSTIGTRQTEHHEALPSSVRRQW